MGRAGGAAARPEARGRLRRAAAGDRPGQGGAWAAARGQGGALRLLLVVSRDGSAHATRRRESLSYASMHVCGVELPSELCRINIRAILGRIICVFRGGYRPFFAGSSAFFFYFFLSAEIYFVHRARTTEPTRDRVRERPRPASVASRVPAPAARPRAASTRARRTGTRAPTPHLHSTAVCPGPSVFASRRALSVAILC